MTLEEFVFDLPLYQKIDATNGYNEIVKSLTQRNKSTRIEGYNPIYKKDSTFYLERGLGELLQYSDSPFDPFYNNYSTEILTECPVKSIVFKCLRYGNEITILVFHDFGNSMVIKVGQYPSVADIHIGKVKQYDKVLDKTILREFTKAIGLAANGVGIGSFVYLRRIFENLVFDAFNEAKNDNAVDKGQFNSLRMDEKIKSLNGYLPSFIVENNSIYGILSKGVHELTEEECLAYFDCMRQSIELILDERLEQLEKKKKEAEVKKTLSSIAGKIKN